jgi:ATP-dependent Clp protease ATP-binding subunit ClpX
MVIIMRMTRSATLEVLGQDFIKVNTQNILFICGGAFVGLERIVEQRLGSKTMGFGAEIKSRSERRLGELLMEVQSEDLLKFGFIPEFIGRLPVVASLDDLDEAALVSILREPKNALIKQYVALLRTEDVKLRFDEEAICEI